ARVRMQRYHPFSSWAGQHRCSIDKTFLSAVRKCLTLPDGRISMKRARRRYFKTLQLQQFRSYCETARLGSFAQAAAALGLSRPAVWQQVRALEVELNARLIVRKGKGVQLTEDGQLLLELIQPLVTGFDSVRSLFEDRKGRLIRQLSLATT